MYLHVDPARALSCECPLRLSPAVHARGDHYHVVVPGRGIRCFRREEDPPEGSYPTDEQRRLWGEAGQTGEGG